MPADTATTSPPREDLFRALPQGIELKRDDAAAADGMPTLTGHFAVFNQWTEISSMWEGNFLERISPGAAKKTIAERGPDGNASMKALFQHGQDPQIGERVLGAISVLREEKTGPYYEVPLLDTAYNRELIPGLEAGLYGASFRFRILREEMVEEPAASAHNPKGLPERTIKEMDVREFGPVTFPAYAGATAGLRSLTDEFLLGRFLDNPDRLRELLEAHVAARKVQVTVPVELGAGTTTTNSTETTVTVATTETDESDRHGTAPDEGTAEEKPHRAAPRRESPTRIDPCTLTREEAPSWRL